MYIAQSSAATTINCGPKPTPLETSVLSVRGIVRKQMGLVYVASSENKWSECVLHCAETSGLCVCVCHRLRTSGPCVHGIV